MTKIYYFSGTGNSLWSAKKIAQIIGEPWELYNIGIEAQKRLPSFVSGESAREKQDEIIIEAKAVVFVFPSYAYGLPLIVRRFIKSAVFYTPYIASFVTFGSNPGGTLGELRRILKKKIYAGINADIHAEDARGSVKLFFGRIPSVENYIAMFGPPKPEKIRNRILLQEKATEEAAQCIIERRENKVLAFRPFSSLVSFLFSFGIKVLYKRYRVGSECNNCGICEKICPVCAIVMKDGFPVFSGRCEHCQGCVNNCPLRAIHFWRVKSGTPGYRHPEIEIADLER